MQFIELAQGDVVIRLRSPREWLQTPEKEAHAKKLIQDQYVDAFVSSVEQAGMPQAIDRYYSDCGSGCRRRQDTRSVGRRRGGYGFVLPHHLGQIRPDVNPRFGEGHHKDRAGLRHDPKELKDRASTATEIDAATITGKRKAVIAQPESRPPIFPKGLGRIAEF